MIYEGNRGWYEEIVIYWIPESNEYVDSDFGWPIYNIFEYVHPFEIRAFLSSDRGDMTFIHRSYPLTKVQLIKEAE